MKPDVIVCWPKDIYYPLFISQMNRDRDLFGRVIVVMTKAETDRDFSEDIVINDCIVLEAKDEPGDWRNTATKAALARSNSERVLFLEQDFFYKRDFIEKLLELDHNMIGFKDDNRFHPACLLVKKKALSGIKLDFSANPPKHDHFGAVTSQIAGETFEELGLENWHHLSGLTYNYRIPQAYHKRDEFYTYCEYCKKLPQPGEWREFSKQTDGFRYDQSPVIADYFYEYIS